MEQINFVTLEILSCTVYSEFITDDRKLKFFLCFQDMHELISKAFASL